MLFIFYCDLCMSVCVLALPETKTDCIAKCPSRNYVIQIHDNLHRWIKHLIWNCFNSSLVGYCNAGTCQRRHSSSAYRYTPLAVGKSTQRRHDWRRVTVPCDTSHNHTTKCRVYFTCSKPLWIQHRGNVEFGYLYVTISVLDSKLSYHNKDEGLLKMVTCAI